MIEISGKINIILEKLYEKIKKIDFDKNYTLVLKEYKRKRTLDQNSLYWKLLNDYATWGGGDVVVLHNQMLCSYGVATDEYAIVRENKEIEKLSGRHYRRTSHRVKGKDGVIYQYCRIMKGSHELNTTEMKRLIDGLINEIIGSGASNDIKIDYEELKSNHDK